MRFLLIFLLGLLACSGQAQSSPEEEAEKPQEVAQRRSWAPQARRGFKVSKWAEVPEARSLAASPDGKYVFVGTRRSKVYKITVADKPKVELFKDGLHSSNGVCFLGPDLLVGERTQVTRYSAADGFRSSKVLVDGLPDRGHHGYRYIKAGPDGRVAIGIGAPCNVCVMDDPRFGSVCSFNGKDGSDFRVIAHGVRNTVGFDWHPDSGLFYFTDNGRDMLGDDIPPCELNTMSKREEGSHYGFPYFWGDNQPDPEYGEKAPKGKTFKKPLVGFQAHVAPLGCHFPRNAKWKSLLGGKLVVAHHGSWNRSVPVGYELVTVDLKNGNKVEPLVWGFLQKVGGNHVYGRPVDITELPDGALLFSDDHEGVIWKLTAE